MREVPETLSLILMRMNLIILIMRVVKKPNKNFNGISVLEQKNTYGIENQNDMTRIHDNKVNKIDERNLLHDIINSLKHTKNLNIHYYPISYGCMNTGKGRAKFKNFQILLSSRCSPTIIMGSIVEKLYPEKDAVIQWHTQAGNITTNLKVKVYFTLPRLRAMNVVTWKCHVDDSAKCRYDLILGRYLLTEL